MTTVIDSKSDVQSILNISKIAKRFGGLEVLSDITFNVRKGERVGIIGPNGAGKTTLFNIIAGDLVPCDGEIQYTNENITSTKNYKRVHQGIVRTFQKNSLLNDLSVLENLIIVLQRKSEVQNTFHKELREEIFPELYKKAEKLLIEWGLIKQKHNIISSLSYGEQRQVEILLGIATEPDVLLLDEPTAGMSNVETQFILDLLKDLPRSLTILIIEHDMEVVFGVSDSVILLHEGQVLIKGEPEVVRNDPRVSEVYMGKEADE